MRCKLQCNRAAASPSFLLIHSKKLIVQQTTSVRNAGGTDSDMVKALNARPELLPCSGKALKLEHQSGVQRGQLGNSKETGLVLERRPLFLVLSSHETAQRLQA